MDSMIKVFLKKFIASLCLMEVNSIPFSGDSFQDGVAEMEAALKENLDEPTYDKISDIFLKTPVQEAYNQIRDMIMELNGNGIAFSAVDNPYWTVLSVKMNEYYANDILNDKSVLNIDPGMIMNVSRHFCVAAGVEVWDE